MKFLVGLLVIPVAVLLIVMVFTAVSLGSIGPIVVPLLQASGLVVWYSSVCVRR